MQKTKLGTFTVWFENSEEYHLLKNEVFTNELYYFECDKANPTIIDLGANIGLATLYFKKYFPEANITAIEPIYKNLRLLELNVFDNNLTNTEVLPVAVAPQAGELTLFTDEENNWHSTAGIIEGNWTKTQNTKPKKVTAVTLSSLITKPIDLLKIDIEGMEQQVLTEAQGQLSLVDQILCEFHPIPDQSLTQLVTMLEKSGFKVTLTKKGKPIKLKQATGMALIHAQR